MIQADRHSPDGRFVYFASRDGWISKFDLYSLETIAEIRAGINTRNLAVSSDGRYAMVANYLPHTLVLLEAFGQVQRAQQDHAVRGHEPLSARLWPANRGAGGWGRLS